MTDMEQQREARKKALRLLEHMDRTEKGLTDRLLRAGFSEELAEDAVSYVKDYGYINDRRYALNYIMYRIHDKSRQKIFQELSGKRAERRAIATAALRVSTAAVWRATVWESSPWTFRACIQPPAPAPQQRRKASPATRAASPERTSSTAS